MSFDQDEESRDEGKPIALYLFRYGPGTAYFAYTNAETPQVFTVGIQSITFNPATISHGDITVDGTLNKTTLDIVSSRDLPLIERLVDVYTSTKVNVKIWLGHWENPEFKLFWTGTITAADRGDSEITYSCEPASSTLRRLGARRNWTIQCPLLLYGTGLGQCNANEAAVTQELEVISVTNAAIVLSDGWEGAVPKAKYQGGRVRWTTDDGRSEVRTIIKSDSDENQLILSAQLSGLVGGMTVFVSPGCNHQRSTPPDTSGDCATIHNNVLNYGGQAWIPDKNPFGIVNNFY